MARSVGDAVGRGEGLVLRRSHADLQIAGEPMRHGDEMVRAADQARLVADQHADLGKTMAEHEAFEDIQQRRLIVDVRLEIGSHDGDQALTAGSDRLGRGAHFLERGEHMQRLGGRPALGLADQRVEQRPVLEAEARKTCARGRERICPGGCHLPGHGRDSPRGKSPSRSQLSRLQRGKQCLRGPRRRSGVPIRPPIRHILPARGWPAVAAGPRAGAAGR